MVNNYATIKEAINAWKTDRHWIFCRTFFKRIGEACICKEGERFFIITHRDCVDYRKKKGDFVKDLNI